MRFTSDEEIPKRKASRAGLPKVKSGCVTCKARRVKCDETKPGCTRCFRLRGRCGGYEVLVQVKKAVVSPSLHAIAPKTHREKHVLTYSTSLVEWLPSPPNSVILLYEPPVYTFQDDLEYSYFRLFREQTVGTLSGYFRSGVWERLILQACEYDVSLRHAVVAIAALDITSREDPHPLPQQGDDARSHHSFALQQYVKAIKLMKQAAEGTRNDLRTKLISSMLIVCFEQFHGNFTAAVSQIKVGCSLIQERSRVVESTPSIEDELIRAFTRMDVQAQTYMRYFRPDEFCFSAVDTGILSSVPTTFDNVEEARDFLELLMQHLPTIPGTDLADAPWDSLKIAPGKAASNAPSTKDLLAAFSKWHAAFQTFLNHHYSKDSNIEDQNHLLAEKVLRVQYLSCTAWLKFFYGEESAIACPKTLPLIYQEIMQTAVFILQQSDRTGRKCKYFFDCQIVAPLFVVATSCPDIPTRSKALDILLTSSRREGFWDSRQAGKMAESLLLMNEKDCRAL